METEQVSRSDLQRDLERAEFEALRWSRKANELRAALSGLTVGDLYTDDVSGVEWRSIASTTPEEGEIVLVLCRYPRTNNSEPVREEVRVDCLEVFLWNGNTRFSVAWAPLPSEVAECHG